MNLEEFGRLLALVLITLAAGSIAGAVDAARIPNEQWQLTGHNRKNWVLLQLGLTLLSGLGFIATAIYLARIRPKLTSRR